MRLLVACEYSGVVRDAFAKRGWDAWSCDLLPTESPGQHLQCEVQKVLNSHWDLLIAHPPCTYLANSGVCRLNNYIVDWGGVLTPEDKKRWDLLTAGANFFKLFLDSNVPYICIENPVMHEHARTLIGNVKPTQVIQPWMFGHKECKATCLWLKNLPKLKPTNNVKYETYQLPYKERQTVLYGHKTHERAKARSKTYQGIADAMAEQWTTFLVPEPMKKHQQQML